MARYHLTQASATLMLLSLTLLAWRAGSVWLPWLGGATLGCAISWWWGSFALFMEARHRRTVNEMAKLIDTMAAEPRRPAAATPAAEEIVVRPSDNPYQSPRGDH